MRFPCFPQLGQFPESLDRNGSQELVAIGKVPIGGVVGDVCAPGDFPSK